MGHPKHILLLNVYFAPFTYGGATVVAESVAQELQKSTGCRVTVISTVQRDDLVPYSVLRSEVDGIQNFLINLPVDRNYEERYDSAFVTSAVMQILEDLQPDLVHAHCIQELGVGFMQQVKRREIPLVLSIHDFWWLCERQFMIRPSGTYCAQNPIKIDACRGCVDNMARAKVRFELLQNAATCADVITFPSHFARDLYVNSGFPGDRCVVWENGVRPPGEGFFEKQAQRRAQNSHIVFGFVGGPSQIKGWPLIKSAFQKIERSDFEGLVVDGSLDGTWWKHEKLHKLQGEWRVHPRFSQAEIDDFFSKIDVLLFLSQWKETFGLTIREAVSRGIRVIQTDSGGTAEWQGADPAQMLQIGDGAGRLLSLVEDVLEDAQAHPSPRPVTNYTDQAQEFLKLVDPLVA